MWSNEQNVLSLLADLYDRLPEYQQIQGWWEFTNFDDAFASNAGDYWRHQEQSFPYDWWGYWDYGYIREINLFIDRKSTRLNSSHVAISYAVFCLKNEI